MLNKTSQTGQCVTLGTTDQTPPPQKDANLHQRNNIYNGENDHKIPTYM